MNDKYNNELDGIEFINIYSNGKTELGRLLSHFSKSQFLHPYFGYFASVEGFWYYMRTAERPDRLRYLYAHVAKHEGKKYKPNWYPHFWEDVAGANYQKIIQNQKIMDLMIASELPFVHYYMFSNPEKTAEFSVKARDADKLCAYMEEIRTALKKGEQPKTWVEAEKRYVEMNNR